MDEEVLRLRVALEYRKGAPSCATTGKKSALLLLFYSSYYWYCIMIYGGKNINVKGRGGIRNTGSARVPYSAEY